MIYQFHNTHNDNNNKKRIIRVAILALHFFSEPDFVSAYEIGEFVYFFFREVAVEFINCGKVSMPHK